MLPENCHLGRRPVVVVNKDKNNIRICTDMRCANKAIQQTR